MFFLKKNNLVDKSDALVGRNDPIENELFHEINGRNLMEIPNDFEIIIPVSYTHLRAHETG